MPDTNVAQSNLAPFSLRDAPAMIERVFPAQKIGIEAQKERKAGAGQTLTALGSYWKGRKPLVLVRATVLASLLPGTDDPQADLEVFDLLMRMDEEGVRRRNPKVSAGDVYASPAISGRCKEEHIVVAADCVSEADGEPDDAKANVPKWRPIPKGIPRAAADETRAQRTVMMQAVLPTLPFSRQASISDRVEDVEDLSREGDPLYAGIWDRVNGHLGTKATSLPQLVEQLGTARFGHRPTVGDPFAGGGSIPFEAARIGCDALASDLNPVAAMLTWGGLAILEANDQERGRIAAEQERVSRIVEAEIAGLGVEEDELGNRAKAYLYCLETVDPQTGWRVPMSPTWVISTSRRCAARLVPDYGMKRFDILVEENLAPAAMLEAAKGTVDDGILTYRLAVVEGGEEQEYRLSVSRLRGDGEGVTASTGEHSNLLRPWTMTDVAPHEPRWDPQRPAIKDGSGSGQWVGGDILLERLYAVQWIEAKDLANGRVRPRSWFASPTKADMDREARVLALVQANLAEWQRSGWVPDMRIEPGDKTTEPIRTRGWTFWHHLFNPRQILFLSLVRRNLETGFGALHLANLLNFWSRLCGIHPRSEGSGRDTCLDRVFINQALNTLYNYGCRASAYEASNFEVANFPSATHGHSEVKVQSCSAVADMADLWIYDPPYADAVHYHEITEYFIAWLRKSPPAPFDTWKWDSRRPLAIQGRSEGFRRNMIAAFSAMARNMPSNGLQVCMFTHKDAGVWADMAGIVWASGLRVTAAWYISTETTSERKKGGYVQGTVLLALRKQGGDEHGFKSEIVPEVRERVKAQVETLTGLNQRARGRGREENLFSDEDIRMAGYAAALEVLTVYTHIDGVDMTREALRPREERRRGQPAATASLVEEMIDLAVSTASELMIPEGIAEAMWDRLSPAARFYLSMAAAEGELLATDQGGKLSDYQNAAKAYRAQDWEALMASQVQNRARLKSATEFRAALLRGHAISEGPLRPTLYAIMSLAKDAGRDVDPEASGKAALHGLRDHFGEANWMGARDNVKTLAAWLGRTWSRRNPPEAAAARVLAGLIGSERL